MLSIYEVDEVRASILRYLYEVGEGQSIDLEVSEVRALRSPSAVGSSRPSVTEPSAQIRVSAKVANRQVG